MRLHDATQEDLDAVNNSILSLQGSINPDGVCALDTKRASQNFLSEQACCDACSLHAFAEGCAHDDVSRVDVCTSDVFVHVQLRVLAALRDYLHAYLCNEDLGE